VFTLLRGGQLFDPDDRGVTDILICGETVAAIARSIDPAGLPPPIEVHDLGGARVVPGLIDAHIHLMGGGGGEGYGYFTNGSTGGARDQCTRDPQRPRSPTEE
jgi:beta-aspartyl-dipeptidase (metallo-type)